MRFCLSEKAKPKNNENYSGGTYINYHTYRTLEGKEIVYFRNNGDKENFTSVSCRDLNSKDFRDIFLWSYLKRLTFPYNLFAIAVFIYQIPLLSFIGIFIGIKSIIRFIKFLDGIKIKVNMLALFAFTLWSFAVYLLISDLYKNYFT